MSLSVSQRYTIVSCLLVDPHELTCNPIVFNRIFLSHRGQRFAILTSELMEYL